MKSDVWIKSNADRRAFIGVSDARIFMGDDEGALLRLWREKRGEIEPEDLSRHSLKIVLIHGLRDRRVEEDCASRGAGIERSDHHGD